MSAPCQKNNEVFCNLFMQIKPALSCDRKSQKVYVTACCPSIKGGSDISMTLVKNLRVGHSKGSCRL